MSREKPRIKLMQSPFLPQWRWGAFIGGSYVWGSSGRSPASVVRFLQQQRALGVRPNMDKNGVVG